MLEEYSGWMPFGKLPINGVYWIAGDRPVYDCDVDDSGRPIGVWDGKTGRYMSLVEIEFDPAEGIFEVSAVSPGYTGDWEEDHTITHFMLFSPPALPEDVSKPTS